VLNHQKLNQVDPDVSQYIKQELNRQENGIELIASENFVSPAVLEAMGSVLTNKYAEGYPSKRYYGGCEFVDQVESLAIERTRTLFGCDYANVQPHSGSQANMAVYFSVLKPQDKFLAMNLEFGGHLTHGASVNFSGKLYQPVFYGVSADTGLIDYVEVERLAELHRPKLIVAGASSYSRMIDFEAFSLIAKKVGAFLMVDMAHIAGLVAAGVHQSPVPYADFVTTTTHKTLRGPRGGIVMAKEPHAKMLNSNLFPGIQGGPLMHVIAAKAVALKEALDPSFKEYQQQVIKNAQALAQALIDLKYHIVSGGTDNHLMLIDLRAQQKTGKEAESLLYACGITVNKNKIPFDPAPATITSGIRLGTPAITSRGFKEPQMRQVAQFIHRALHTQEVAQQHDIKNEIEQLCRQFPLYSTD